MRPCCTNRPGAIGKQRVSLFSMEKIIVRGISFSTFFTELARDFLFCKRRFSREYPIAIAIGMQTNADAGWQDE